MVTTSPRPQRSRRLPAGRTETPQDTQQPSPEAHDYANAGPDVFWEDDRPQPRSAATT